MNTNLMTLHIITSPLDQFEIRDLISLDLPVLANIHLSLTNIGLYLILAFSITLVFNTLATNQNKVVSNN
jgi:F-type H+-transporting ATPase subunit a